MNLSFAKKDLRPLCSTVGFILAIQFVGCSSPELAYSRSIPILKNVRPVPNVWKYQVARRHLTCLAVVHFCLHLIPISASINIGCITFILDELLDLLTPLSTSNQWPSRFPLSRNAQSASCKRRISLTSLSGSSLILFFFDLKTAPIWSLQECQGSMAKTKGYW